MSLSSAYKGIKLVYGKKLDQIKNLNQDDWILIFERLGLYVSVSNGRGSHCAVYKSKDCPPENSECCIATLPHKIFPNFQRDLVKKAVYYGLLSKKYSEEDFWRVAGV